MKKEIKKTLKVVFGKKIAMKLMFLQKNKYWPNLKNPKTYNEKIQFRKFYGNNKLYSKYADKVLFRETIERLIGEAYLVPSYGAFEELTLEVWKKLPEAFVIKASHGSGPDFIEIVKEKSEADFIKIRDKFKKVLKYDFGKETDELFYSVAKPKLLIEKYLDFGSQNGLIDYKFHMFNRKEDSQIFIQIDSGRFTNHQRDFYDGNWNMIDMKINTKYAHVAGGVDEPKDFKKMKAIAQSLSAPFDYVRVDFFNLNGKIYLGEMTFCHGGGFENFSPKEKDYEWGKLWEFTN